MVSFIKSMLVVTLISWTYNLQAYQNEISTHIDNPLLIGEAKLTYFIFDVYNAKLYAPYGEWKPNKPFALSINYLRELNGKDIAQAGVDQMRYQGYYNESKLNKWGKAMSRIFPNVREGSNITGVRDEQGHTIFYFNGNKIGQIEDREFTRRFFDIWLGKKSSEPYLRLKLLGLK